MVSTELGYDQLLSIAFSVPMPYEWSVGVYGSLFFHEIMNHNRFLGVRCPDCNKVYMPPRRLCGPCFKELDKLVVLPNEGTIEAFSIVNYPFVDPNTGEQRPIPYTYGYIRIDGADTIFSHIINETDTRLIQVGMKVKAVFREKELMQGNVQDIKHFEIVNP